MQWPLLLLVCWQWWMLARAQADSDGVFQSPRNNSEYVQGERIPVQWAFLDTDIPSEIEVVALHRGDVYAEIRGGNPKLNMVMEVPFDMNKIRSQSSFSTDWTIPKTVGPGKEFYFRIHVEKLGYWPAMSPYFHIKPAPAPAVTTPSTRPTETANPPRILPSEDTPEATPTPKPSSPGNPAPDDNTDENPDDESSKKPESDPPAKLAPTVSVSLRKETVVTKTTGVLTSTLEDGKVTAVTTTGTVTEVVEKPAVSEGEEGGGDEEDGGEKRAMSTVALVGISVGSTLALVLFLIFVAVVLFRRRRRNLAGSDSDIKTLSNDSSSNTGITFTGDSKLLSDDAEALYNKKKAEYSPELDSGQVHEMNTDPAASEMATTADASVHELGWTPRVSISKTIISDSDTANEHTLYSLPIGLASTVFSDSATIHNPTLHTIPIAFSPGAHSFSTYVDSNTITSQDTLQPNNSLLGRPTFTHPGDEMAWLEREERERQLWRRQQRNQ